MRIVSQFDLHFWGALLNVRIIIFVIVAINMYIQFTAVLSVVRGYGGTQPNTKKLDGSQPNCCSQQKKLRWLLYSQIDLGIFASALKLLCSK